MVLSINLTEIEVAATILISIIGGIIWLAKKLQNLEDRIKALENDRSLEILLTKDNSISNLNKELSKLESKIIKKGNK